MPKTQTPIPIVFIADSNFSMQTAVAITSVFGTKAPETEYVIYIIAAGCKAEDMGPLQGLPQVRIVEVPLDSYKDIRQNAHIPIACLLKFAVCDLVPEFDKLIYLDGDVIVRGDLTSMYSIDLEDAYAAAVFARVETESPDKKINAGVMLFNAKKMRDEGMSGKLMEFRRGLGDRGSMDQQTFNLMLGKSIKPLHVRYNCTAAQFQDDVSRKGWEALNAILETGYPDLESMVDDACIIHYNTGFKPWKYSHTPYGDEWYSWFKRSPFADQRLSRKGRIGQCLDILAGEYRNGGLFAVGRRLVAAVWHRIIGEKPETIWG